MQRRAPGAHPSGVGCSSYAGRRGGTQPVWGTQPPVRHAARVGQQSPVGQAGRLCSRFAVLRIFGERTSWSIREKTWFSAHVALRIC